MQIKDFSKDDPLIKEIDLKKTVLLVGAGISLDNPTCLPSGKVLTDYYLEISVGKESAKRLRNIWSNINNTIRENSQFEFPLMRLEFIIGHINKVDKELRRPPLITGINQFAEADFNKNHQSIARIIKGGGTVITPNFDNCIEKAIGGSFEVNDAIGFPVMFQNKFQIYYFHGIAADIEGLKDNLGATIDKIKEGLAKKFEYLLTEWLKNGYTLIMVGYSASDFFDIIPFFESIPNNSFSGTAIFFQHDRLISSNDLHRVKKCLSPFVDQIVLNGNGETSQFLEALSLEKADEIYKQVEKDWWKVKFNEIIDSYNEEEKACFNGSNVIRICDQIGLNIDLIVENSRELVNNCVKMEAERSDLEKYFESLPDKEESIIPALRRLHTKQYLEELKADNFAYYENYRSLNDRVQAVYDRWYSPLEKANSISFTDFCERIQNGAKTVSTYNSALVYAANIHTKRFIQ